MAKADSSPARYSTSPAMSFRFTDTVLSNVRGAQLKSLCHGGKDNTRVH